MKLVRLIFVLGGVALVWLLLTLLPWLPMAITLLIMAGIVIASVIGAIYNLFELNFGAFIGLAFLAIAIVAGILVLWPVFMNHF